LRFSFCQSPIVCQGIYYIERSHYCLGIALRCVYTGQIVGLLNTIDKIRLSRHNVQYGGELVDEEEAEFVIKFAEDFLLAARTELLKVA
jgi:uncharacterized protein (UPF0332 family)